MAGKMTRADVAACHFELFHSDVKGGLAAKAAEMDSQAFAVAFMLVMHEMQERRKAGSE